MVEYSDQKRCNLFNGDGIAYIRMRADKHEKVYNLKKQAEHLRNLANELEKYKDFYLNRNMKMQPKTEHVNISGRFITA